MRAVRRFYFYLVAFIAAEVIVWGVISLLRTLFAELPLGGTANILAGGLAAVLVGLPVFGLHWSVVQRDAARSVEEAGSTLRAVFLYGIRLALLVPLAQSAVAILNRLLLGLFDLGSTYALVGGNQSYADNFSALLVTAAGLAYFERVLRAEWASPAPDEARADLRRLFRYAWLLYTLTLLLWGVISLLRFVLERPVVSFFEFGALRYLPGGIALALVAAPLWALAWRTIQASLPDPAETRSILRLVVLYALSLGSLLVLLLSAGNLLAALLRLILGQDQTLRQWWQDNLTPLSLLLPFGVLWVYFVRVLFTQIATEPEGNRRSALVRLFRSVLALGGNIATVGGLLALVQALVELIFTQFLPGVRGLLAGGVSALVVGVPLWLRAWPPLQAEAAGPDGGPARGSVLRRGYLYLLVFASLVGVMGMAGWLLYLLFSLLLGNPAPDAGRSLLLRALMLAVLAVWLVYHLRVLRADGVHAPKVAAAGFVPESARVLILAPEGMSLPAAVLAALQRQSPHLAVSLRDPLAELPAEPPTVLVLPGGLALNPPPPIAAWLAAYTGPRVLLPDSSAVWAGLIARPEADTAREAARAVQQLIDGQPVRAAPPLNGWVLAGYVLAALFGLQMLILLLSLGLRFAD
jgi:hypothetical protein